MARKRSVAFCMAVITILFVFACIPVAATEKSVKPCSDDPLPLSLASPVNQRVYILPSYDEAASFTPARKLYELPASYELYEAREILCDFAVCEDLGQVPDLCCIESITPRAP